MKVYGWLKKGELGKSVVRASDLSIESKVGTYQGCVLTRVDSEGNYTVELCANPAQASNKQSVPVASGNVSELLTKGALYVEVDNVS